MNSRMKQLRVAGLMAGALLLSTGLKAQTGTSGENGKAVNLEPQPLVAYTVMPSQGPKASPLAVLQLPAENGNKEAELKSFAQTASDWAGENPEKFNALDQATKDLFNSGNYEALMNKVKDLQTNPKK